MTTQAIILAVIQALTEFLPISSSAHLFLTEKLFHLSFDLSFDVFIHFGSALALIIYFAKDWKRFFQEKDWRSSMLLKIALALIPAAILGIILEKSHPSFWRTINLSLFNLIFFAVVLIWADKKAGAKTIKQLGFIDVILIGLAQALALFPGVSRSGITISMALFIGLTRKEAAKFSFLLATPAILGATVLEAPKIVSLHSAFIWPYVVGFLTSFVFSYLVIAWLLKYLQSHRLWPFAVWRFLVASGVITYFLIK